MTTPSTPTKITVDRFIDVKKAAKDTATPKIAGSDDLKEAVQAQSGLIYYYSECYAKAVRQAARLKLQLERKEAQVAAAVRHEFNEAKAKFTVDQVKEAVLLDKEVLALKVAKIDADEVEMVLKGIINALRDKSDNLQVMVHMHRDEIKAKLAFEDDIHGSASPRRYAKTGSPD